MDRVSLGAELLKVIGFLGLLVFGCALVLKARGRRGLQRRGGRLEVVDSLGLGGNRLLCLIKLGKSHVLVGVTDQSVNLVKEFKEEELPDGGLSAGGPGFPEAGTGGDDSAATSFMQFLSEEYKKARKRLSGKEFKFLLGLVLVAAVLPLLLFPGKCTAAPSTVPVPDITVNIDGQQAKGGLGTSLGILGMLTVLTLAPAILILTTSFTRIIIVFSFLRSGLGTQQAPPNQVLVGLALILTFFIMTPTWNAAYRAR